MIGSLAVGMLPDLISPIGSILVCSLGLLALMILALRRAFQNTARGEPSFPPAPHTTDGSATELRLARGLFFLGCLLVGQLSFRYVAGLTLSELMFIAAFGACAFAVLRGHAVITLPMPMLGAVSIFAFGGAISSLDAQSPPSSVFQLLHAIYVFLLWPWVGAMVVRTKRQMTTALALWSVSAAIDGAAAIVQLSGAHLLGLVSSGNRMTGFTDHPNDLGGVTAVALVPALMIGTHAVPGRSVRMRALRWVPVSLTAIGLSLSGSVSAMAAGAIAILVWLSSPIVRAPARLAVATAVVSALAVVMVAGGKVNSPVQRLAQVGDASSQNGGSVQDRFAIAAQASPRIVRDPFVGTGLDTADSGVTILSHGYTARYQIHGLPLAALYQVGIFGMLGLMALIAALATFGWRALRSAAADDEVLTGLALVGAFMAFVIVAMTQPMVFQQYGWITAVFIFAWAARAETVSDPPPPLHHGDLTPAPRFADRGGPGAVAAGAANNRRARAL